MAVYTHLSKQEMQAISAPYGLGELEAFTGIAQGVENSNYLLKFKKNGTTTPVIFTIFEKRVNATDLPFFMALMDHLQSAAIGYPHPYKKADGAVISMVGEKFAAFVSFVAGGEHATPDIVDCAQFGDAVAELHTLTASFAKHRENALAPDRLYPLYEKVRDSLPRWCDSVTLKEIEKELAELQHWQALALPRGIIHADLFKDNVFFQDGKLSGMIDLYFACEDYLLYDVAIAMNDWCFMRDGAFERDKSSALLQAYDARRRLENAEWEALPALCRAAAIRFLLTRAHDMIHHDESAIVTAKDPAEYVRKWQTMRELQHYRDYLL
jgi:homoserine kinase type II